MGNQSGSPIFTVHVKKELKHSILLSYSLFLEFVFSNLESTTQPLVFFFNLVRLGIVGTVREEWEVDWWIGGLVDGFSEDRWVGGLGHGARDLFLDK